MLILYHDTEIILGDMVLLGAPGNLTEDHQTRTAVSTRTAYIVKVGKRIARRESLEG
jgi:hypothetical protein